MKAWIKYSELQRRDLFVVDPLYTGQIGRVNRVHVTEGSKTVTVDYTNLGDDREFLQEFNADHITKYLRHGETDPRLNIGRG